jgi:hypothetical protein
MSDVLVVLTCYSRPQNMGRVIDAWNQQTVPVTVVVVDNRPYTKITIADGAFGDPIKGELYPCYELSGDGYLSPSDVWRWTKNSGCPCWLAPAAMLYRHKYVVKADDDFLPGTRAVDHLLKTAMICDDEFSTIGQVGRILTPGKYHRGNVKLRDFDSEAEMTRVDLTCRGFLVKSRDIIHALDFRQQLLDSDPESEEIKHLVGIHDDFLICMGTQLCYESRPSYIISSTRDPEDLLIKTEIPNGPESCYKRPGHYEERQRMVELSESIGWRSLV